jgi:hypothetical protein
MIIAEQNTLNQFYMYLRDFEDMTTFNLKVYSESERKLVFSTTLFTPSGYDDFRKLLNFALNINSTYNPESFYVIKIWSNDESKLLSQDRMYVIPEGASVSTYQPKLATTQKTMDNEFKIYGE